MHETKFITLLETLSIKEFNNFEQYLQAFYSNRNRDLSVFAYISLFKKNLRSEELNRTIALKKNLNKEGITEDNLMSNILPKLYHYLEEFLAWKKFTSKNNNFQKDKLILDVFQERHLDSLFTSKLNKLEKEFDKKKPNMWSELNKFKVKYLKYFTSSNENKTKKGIVMQEMMESLDQFIIGSKLKLSCEQALREKITGKKVKINLFEEVQTLSQEYPFKKKELHQIYILFLEVIETPNDIKYDILKKLVEKSFYKEEKYDQSINYGFLFNYMAGELRNGKTKFVKELKNWIEFGLKNKLLYTGKYIAPVAFNNQINLACVLKDLDLAENIISKYSKDVKDSEKIDTLLIARAYIDFEKEAYKTIIEKLYPPYIKNRFLNLRARLILLKTFFEIDDFVALGDFIKACNKALRRTKDLGEDNKLSFNNTLKFTKKLMDPNTDLKIFEKEIRNADYIFNKSWFLERIKKPLKF